MFREIMLGGYCGMLLSVIKRGNVIDAFSDAKFVLSGTYHRTTKPNRY